MIDVVPDTLEVSGMRTMNCSVTGFSRSLVFLGVAMDRTFSSFGWTTMLVVLAATTGVFGIRPLLAQEADPAAEAADLL